MPGLVLCSGSVVISGSFILFIWKKNVCEAFWWVWSWISSIWNQLYRYNTLKMIFLKSRKSRKIPKNPAGFFGISRSRSRSRKEIDNPGTGTEFQKFRSRPDPDPGTEWKKPIPYSPATQWIWIPRILNVFAFLAPFCSIFGLLICFIS